jgi:hypothetical protein
LKEIASELCLLHVWLEEMQHGNRSESKQHLIARDGMMLGGLYLGGSSEALGQKKLGVVIGVVIEISYRFDCKCKTQCLGIYVTNRDAVGQILVGVSEVINNSHK